MKKLPHLSLFLLIISLVSCGPTPKKAAQYNDALITQQRKAAYALDNFIASFTTYDSAAMHQAYYQTVKILKQTIDSVKNMKDFYGNDQFKQQTIKLLTTYQQVTQNELFHVMKLLSKPEKYYTAADSRKVSELITEAQNKIDKAYQEYVNYQQQFAKKYNLRITLEQ